MMKGFGTNEESPKDMRILELEKQNAALQDDVESLSRDVDELLKIQHRYNEVSQALYGKEFAEVQEILAAYDQAKMDDTPLTGTEIVKSNMNLLLKKIKTGRLYDEDVERMSENIAQLGDVLARLIAQERRKANDKRYEKEVAPHEAAAPAEADPEGDGDQV